jgi:thioester reductase-like protein
MDPSPCHAHFHNAWPVNFNYALASFETSISFVRELAELAVSGKRQPTVAFTSSLGTLAWAAAADWVEEGPIESFEVSVGSGYGESKRVAEEVSQSREWYSSSIVHIH